MLSTVLTDRSIPLGAVLEGLSDDVNLKESPVYVPATVESQIKEMIGRRWRVPLGDVHLRWGAAPEGYEVNANAHFRLVGEGSDGWFAVIFRNPGTPGAAIRLRAGVNYRMPVAARRLFAGRVVGDEDIVFQRVTYCGPPAPGMRRVVEPGWRVMKDIDPGAQLSPPIVLPQRVITSGDTVRLQWKRGVITVALQGIAVHDAAMGERITVSLRGGRGESSGIVTGPGKAALDV